MDDVGSSDFSHLSSKMDYFPIFTAGSSELTDVEELETFWHDIGLGFHQLRVT